MSGLYEGLEVNCAPTPMGRAITAVLYVQSFVENSSWVQFNVGACNDRARLGRPKGAEVMDLRAVFKALTNRCS